MQIVFNKLTSSYQFEYGITACIMLNTLTMAMDHHNSSKMFDDTIEALNKFFAIVFNLEMILKLLA